MISRTFGLKAGDKVATKAELGNLDGDGFGERKPNSRGTIDIIVPTHAGNVYWVDHDDGSRGAYSNSELNFTN